jgi:hypothetical protein
MTRNAARSMRFLRSLNDARVGMMEVAGPTVAQDMRGQDGIPAVHDALPRFRGRSKKRQIPNATVRSAEACHRKELIMTCDLCGKGHQLENCPYSHLVLAARLANGQMVSRVGQRKCPLCWGYGQQRRTCPCLRELDELRRGTRLVNNISKS